MFNVVFILARYMKCMYLSIQTSNIYAEFFPPERMFKEQANLKRVHEFELHHDPGRGTLNINIDHSGLHARFTYDGFHLPCNIIEAVVGGSRYVDALLHCLFCLWNKNTQTLEM